MDEAFKIQFGWLFFIHRAYYGAAAVRLANCRSNSAAANSSSSLSVSLTTDSRAENSRTGQKAGRNDLENNLSTSTVCARSAACSLFGTLQERSSVLAELRAAYLLCRNCCFLRPFLQRQNGSRVGRDWLKIYLIICVTRPMTLLVEFKDFPSRHV